MREFCIDDGNERGKDRCKWQTRRLRLHDATGKKATTTNEVFREEFRYDHLDVLNVDSVNNTSDGLPQGVPRQSLILLAGLVLPRCLLQSTQTSRRHIHTSRPCTREFGEFSFRVELRLFALLIILLLQLLQLQSRYACCQCLFSFRAANWVNIVDPRYFNNSTLVRWRS